MLWNKTDQQGLPQLQTKELWLSFQGGSWYFIVSLPGGKCHLMSPSTLLLIAFAPQLRVHMHATSWSLVLPMYQW